MRIDIAAKNLLEGKTCKNCYHRSLVHGDVCYCDVYDRLPEEGTCFDWIKGSDDLQIHHIDGVSSNSSGSYVLMNKFAHRKLHESD